MCAIPDIITSVWTTLEKHIENVPGWSPIEELYSLFNLAYLTADLGGDILEIGAWCGRSSIALGLAARLSGRGNVHSVDLFPEKGDWFENPDGTFSFAVMIGGKRFGAYQSQTVWREPYEKTIRPLYEKKNGILEYFREAISNAGLTDVVRPFRGDIQAFLAAKSQNLSFRVAFLDGDHSYEAVLSDIEAVEPRLLPGGWICFDDAFTTYEGVDRAIRKRIIESGRYVLCQQLTRKFFAARRR